MEDIFTKLVHPGDAKIGDYVFSFVGPDTWDYDIFEVVEIKKGFITQIRGKNGVEKCFQAMPPTKHRKEQYLKSQRLLALPVESAFRSHSFLPKFPGKDNPCSHVVGRPSLQLVDIKVNRTASNYIDVRFGIFNAGSSKVLFQQYEWEEDDKAAEDSTPFAYVNDKHLKVFQVESSTHLYPEHSSHHRVSISNRAEPGLMRLLLPSRLFAGAIGTYTMLAFQVPPPNCSSGC